VLDINLSFATSKPVASRLMELGVPFITVSSYSRDQRPPLFRNAPFIAKPLKPRHLVAALAQCMKL